MQPDKKITQTHPVRPGRSFRRRAGQCLAVFILLLAFTGLTLPTQPVQARPVPAAALSGQEILQLVNQVRAGRGLSPLSPNGALNAAAQAHSEYMASIGSTTHSGANGSSPMSRAIAAGYGGGAAVSVTENIYGGGSAQQAVNWWSNESLHLETMISPRYADAGAGAAGGYYTLLVGAVTGAPGSAATQLAWAAQATGEPSGSATGGSDEAAVPAANPAVTSTPGPDGSVVHVVNSGETLWSISALYDVSILDILSLNGLNANSSVIRPGDEIIIRAAGSMPTATTGLTNSEGTPVEDLAGEKATETPRPTRTPRPTSTGTAQNLAASGEEPAGGLPAEPEPVSKPPSASTQLRARLSRLGIDPVLLLIGGVVFGGLAMMVAGTLMKRADE